MTKCYDLIFTYYNMPELQIPVRTQDLSSLKKQEGGGVAGRWLNS